MPQPWPWPQAGMEINANLTTCWALTRSPQLDSALGLEGGECQSQGQRAGVAFWCEKQHFSSFSLGAKNSKPWGNFAFPFLFLQWLSTFHRAETIIQISSAQYMKLMKIRANLIKAQSPGPTTDLLPRAFLMSQRPGSFYSALLGSATLSVSMISKPTIYHLLLSAVPLT